MMLPWQGDHLPAAIFKIKIRFLNTSSSYYSQKLIAVTIMQIRACPVLKVISNGLKFLTFSACFSFLGKKEVLK
jgi:hypothetical protein